MGRNEEVESQEHNKTLRFNRVKLLRPNETLALGHAYRLVTTQEVVKVLRAKKYAKTKKQQLETLEKLQARQEKQSSDCDEAEEGKSEKENINHATKAPTEDGKCCCCTKVKVLGPLIAEHL
ncbi:hypothetical protein GBA52_003079 [Prunus armeniaca]|nr:hypothetical protein GBA52_003079 [Prunus armeniaca]